MRTISSGLIALGALCSALCLAGCGPPRAVRFIPPPPTTAVDIEPGAEVDSAREVAAGAADESAASRRSTAVSPRPDAGGGVPREQVDKPAVRSSTESASSKPKKKASSEKATTAKPSTASESGEPKKKTKKKSSSSTETRAKPSTKDESRGASERPKTRDSAGKPTESDE